MRNTHNHAQPVPNKDAHKMNPRSLYQLPEPTAEQLSFRKRCAKAKAAAMAGGSVVMV
jgi:hypothetical protein